MKQNNDGKKSKWNIVLLILISFLLGPELYIFAPEILLFFQAAGVEYILASLALVFLPIKEYLLFWIYKVVNNEQLRKYGIFIPLVFLMPFLPEVAIVLDLGIASTLLLVAGRQYWFMSLKSMIRKI